MSLIRSSSLAAVFLVAVAIPSQLLGQSNPRFGTWLLESDRPPPYRNVMTYESYGEGGMRITVASTNPQGESSEWGYVTMFDGEFRTVAGQENAETAVEIVNEQTNRIINRRNGLTRTVIINTLSEDGNTIENAYANFDEEGRITRVTHATYRRIMPGQVLPSGFLILLLGLYLQP